MNKIITKYLLANFLKSVFMWVIIFYCFGIILSLFEEIEFFKNLDVSLYTPLLLTSISVPGIIIKILPFIIFISSMWFMIKIRNNKDLLTMKVFGYSNIKIFFILAFTSLFLGFFVLFIINPVISSMSKYYENTKSKYARDIDHLVTFNKNGLWIKENIDTNKTRIITANKMDGNNLLKVTIFHLDKDFKLIEKILSDKANIEKNDWVLNDVNIFKIDQDFFNNIYYEEYSIKSNYDSEKITSLFKNFDTLPFLDILINYKHLLNNGYNKKLLDENLHSWLSFPFFLFMMTAIAAVLTMNTLKKSDNIKFIMVGIILCITVFYLKDLSLALGQTDRIPLILSVWSPVIALGFFSFIGVLQINEK
tara:strand:+ start:4720 stop:5811 length:1092 start_codon:yes stop_codon:yes gene_type:complete